MFHRRFLEVQGLWFGVSQKVSEVQGLWFGVSQKVSRSSGTLVWCFTEGF